MGFFISAEINVNKPLQQTHTAHPLEGKSERRGVSRWVPWHGVHQPGPSAGHCVQSPLAADSRSQIVSCNRPLPLLPSVEDDRSETEEASLLGWSVSAFIHGSMLVIAAAFSLHAAPAPTIPQREPFRWDILLMAAPKPESIVADGARLQEVLATEEPGFQSAADAQRIEQGSESVAHPEEALVSDAVVGEVVSRSDFQRAPSASGHSVMPEKNAMKVSALAVTNSDASPLPPPEVESQHDSSRLQVETQLANPMVLQRPQAVSRSLMTRDALPDYTWLMDTLRAKLERVKIYPSSARASHSQGRVVVRISIRSNGRILDSEIEESSGHPVLDQAALDALQAASPLTLVHSLEGESVVMLVPLSYQLE